MFSFSTRVRGLVALALAVTALGLGITAPARAQPARFGPRMPLDARGFQISQAQMQYFQAAATNHAYRAAEPDTSAVEAPRYVSIRTPDGRVRYFLLEGPVTVVPFHPGVVAHYPPEGPANVAPFHPGVVAHYPR
jgi:hypothetical protein